MQNDYNDYRYTTNIIMVRMVKQQNFYYLNSKKVSSVQLTNHLFASSLSTVYTNEKEQRKF